MAQQAATEPILIKRYAGRRLYDTELGRYVTAADVAALAQGRRPVVVQEAGSGEDITSAVLSEADPGNA
jgi:polyhydroxyalkanoate synthesis regulator protein